MHLLVNNKCKIISRFYTNSFKKACHYFICYLSGAMLLLPPLGGYGRTHAAGVALVTTFENKKAPFV
nr:MAG TPA: hypothetical protein [Caudoviricetes sp.]